MQNSKCKIQSCRGQSLVETVAALGVSVLIIGALVSLGVAALRSSGAAKNAAEAQTLVNEEMELIRAYRDRAANYDTFETNIANCVNSAADLDVCDILGGVGDQSCYIDVSTVTPSLSPRESVVRGGVTFYRCLNYDVSSPSGKARVVAIVTWEDSRGTHATVAETYLAKWQ